MLFNQKLLAAAIAAGLLIFIIETVRRRKLREEYAWLWVLVGVITLVLSLWEDLLQLITGLLGIQLPVNTVFFFGLLFVVFIILHFSVKISQLTNQVKRLTQELAITAGEKNRLLSPPGAEASDLSELSTNSGISRRDSGKDEHASLAE